ncbi:MAG: 3-deoxy-manno-octulosonate cytidylyltransferase [Alphaproteobacteria bacterium]|nr:3-deoxy-manno-octulosonate cytidylyltransferase [Alphaproteobacteria bacterium]
MNPIVVIPSRLAAVRLPNKPLAEIHGLPMVVHVLRRAGAAVPPVGPVIVACGDAAIAEAVRAAGGRAVMTDPALASGSDRVFAAVEAVDPGRNHDVVINLQGDLPTVDPALLPAVLRPLLDAKVDIATIAAVITDSSERDNPNVVKAIVAPNSAGSGGRALYFTRATAPSGEGPLYHHIGIYAFRRSALIRFVSLPPSTLERRERLEQLRAMEDGMRIDVAFVDTIPLGVDTPADLARARMLLQPRGGR